MYFKDIIGHTELKAHLVELVQNQKIPHAQLFAGADGIGKLPLALATARYIHCTGRTSTDSCGVCSSCRKYDNYTHPDLHFVFPVARPPKKKWLCDDCMNDWRTFIKQNPYFEMAQWLNYVNAENSQALIYSEESQAILRKMSMKPYESPYKVMVIWMPERLHPTCANKLLKLIEEPSPNTFIIMSSASPELVLGTIQSRVQRINVRSLSDDEIMQALISKYKIDNSDAQTISKLALGSYVKAIQTIQINQDSEVFLSFFTLLMRLAYQRKIKELKQWSEEVAGLGRERQRRFLTYAQRLVRENFILNFESPELNYLTPEEHNFSKRFAPFINHRNVMQINEELERAERDIIQNANAKILFFDVAVKMIMLLKQS